MKRVSIHSRGGNIALAILGGIYALSALALLVQYATSVWNAASLLDKLLQFALLCAAVCGIWFVSLALPNLGIHLRRQVSGTSNPASIHR